MKYPTRTIQADIREIEKEKIGKFGVIVADCPWSYRYSDGVAVPPTEHYDEITVNDLCNIPVCNLSTKDSVLYLWGTWPLLPECLQVMKAWGYEFISGFPWIKMSKEKVFGVVGGYWVLGVSEYCLIGKKGNAHPPAPADRYLGIIAPNLKHSKKPNSVHEMAETLPGPYLELFAREAREGWTCIGNQIDGSSKRTEKVIQNNMKMF